MICPACGSENLPGEERCTECTSDLMQEDVPQPDTGIRWRVMVDPISSLEASTIPPQVVPAGTSLAEGVGRMREKNVGYLLVVDGDGKLTGILTENDLVRHVAGREADLGAYTVDQFMTPNPRTLKPSEPIKHALHCMALDGFRYIPLVDDEGRPVDLLSFRRVARLLEHMG
jgi:CBS domain-containing protein